ncbi:MAG TPA: sensor domain-containing diguanylate cyclase, partial [Acidimicrobiia bacterium]|nr:sensor domain-containing diguanylate cyclase [Acidimicrobiia bacterium]
APPRSRAAASDDAMTRDKPVGLPEPSQAPTIGALEVVGGRRATALIRQTALTELARTALLGIPQRPLLTRAARLVQTVLDAGSCGIYEYLPGGHGLLLRATAFAPGQPAHPDTVDVTTAVVAAPDTDGSAPAGTALMVPIRTSPPFGFLAARRDHGGFDDEDGHFALQVADILAAALERLRAQENERQAALLDPLTGLPNRALILDHLRLALSRSRRRPSTVGVLFVDLDHFKIVNDTMGHEAGDAVLVATGERLRAALRPPDTVGRLGGDEFVAICEDIGGAEEVLAVAERLAASLHRSVHVAGRDVPIRASIGVALSTSNATEPAALLTEADGAMFWAKRSGVGIALFEERMRVGTVHVQPRETAKYAAVDRSDWSNVPCPRMGAGGRLVARLIEVLESIDDPDRLDLRDRPAPGIQRP